MCDKKSRTKLSKEDKMDMFAYKEEHLDASFNTIAEIFTEKLNKKIHRTMTFKNDRRMKKQKEEGLEFNQAAMMRSRLCPTIQIKFEKLLYDAINDRLMRDTLTYDTVQILATRLQNSDEFKEDEHIKAMRFSNRWWEQYKPGVGKIG